MKYYCLDSSGELYFIGLHASFDDADTAAQDMGLDAIWLVNDTAAQQWRNTLAAVKP